MTSPTRAEGKLERLWKQIPLPRGLYEVSNDGQVRNAQGHVLKPIRAGRMGIDGKSYFGVHLPAERGFKTFYIHFLVANAFLGTPAPRATVNHINGDKNDNRASNLEWLSLADNIRHAVKSGLSHRTKIAAEKVRSIRRHLSDGYLTKFEIGFFYDVSELTVVRIERGTSYGGVV